MFRPRQLGLVITVRMRKLTRDPGDMLSMISFLVTIPDKGIPLAKPFANTMTSGVTPECSIANTLPVRQKPVWISSTSQREVLLGRS